MTTPTPGWPMPVRNCGNGKLVVHHRKHMWVLAPNQYAWCPGDPQREEREIK